MSDKDDIFDMEFGEEAHGPASPPKLHRGRSTSLSVTLHHSKALLKAKEQEAREYELERRRARAHAIPTLASSEDRPQEDEDGEVNGNEEDEKSEDNENDNENDKSTQSNAGGPFVPTRNYNAVKMKYFQALNINNKSAPMEAAPRTDPNAIFSQPIQSAPTSAPIPIAADHRFFYEITGQTVETVSSSSSSSSSSSLFFSSALIPLLSVRSSTRDGKGQDSCVLGSTTKKDFPCHLKNLHFNREQTATSRISYCVNLLSLSHSLLSLPLCFCCGGFMSDRRERHLTLYGLEFVAACFSFGNDCSLQ
jgi:hypothetical protein